MLNSQAEAGEAKIFHPVLADGMIFLGVFGLFERLLSLRQAQSHGAQIFHSTGAFIKAHEPVGQFGIAFETGAVPNTLAGAKYIVGIRRQQHLQGGDYSGAFQLRF